MNKSFSKIKQFAREFIHSRNWPRRPEIINLEITAACDARCIHCPRLEMDRPMRAMSRELFERIVDQSTQLGVPYLCPNGYGEICTLPIETLREYLELLRERNRDVKIIINTNGNRMLEDRAELFIKYGVHVINVTIDGATAETAQAIRVNLDFHRIETNIEQLIAMRDARGAKHPKVRVGMIVMPQTVPEVDEFFRRWNGIADFVGMGGYSSRLASVEIERTEDHQTGDSDRASFAMPTRCVLPFRELNIWADGKAVLCCEDWNEEMVVGDLNEQTIDEIWHGPVLAEARRKHMELRGGEIAICAKCNNWQQPGFGTRLWK